MVFLYSPLEEHLYISYQINYYLPLDLFAKKLYGHGNWDEA